MRILHVSDNSYPNIGGVERVVHEISKRQVELGHEVVVISQLETFSKSVLKIEKDGVRYLKVPKAIFPIYSRTFALSFSPDLIHLNSYLSSPLFTKSNAPVLRHIHDVYGELSKNYFSFINTNLMSTLERFLVKGFGYYILPSYSTFKKLRKIVGTKAQIWIVPNGVDLKIFHPRERGWLRKRIGVDRKDFVIGFVGRIAIGKGALDAFKASVPLLKEGNAQLVYIGPKDTVSTSGQRSAFSAIKYLSEKLGLKNKVFYLPPLRDEELACAYCDLDVLVLPSVSEGFGLTVLEAAACGTPSIVYDSGSLCELVENEKTGYIVPRGDVNSLTHALRKMKECENSEKQMMRNCCLKKAFLYDWKNVIERLFNVYASVLKR